MWNKIDRALEIYSRQYSKEQKYMSDSIQDIFNSIGFEYTTINNYANKRDLERFKRVLEKNIKSIEKDTYIYYQAQNYLKMKRIRNIEILRFLVYLEYYKFQRNMTTYEEELFLLAINEAVLQAKREIEILNPKKRLILDTPNIILLNTLLIPNNLGYVWGDYIENITKYNAEELSREMVLKISLNNKLNINDKDFQKILLKQRKRQININDNSFSGAIENEVDNLFNQTKLDIGLKNDIKKCRFIAVEDKRTTKMCDTLNNQIFKLDEMNVYQRYSETDGRIVTYHTKGLKIGENLPPINNHFHYCRSTITYQLDESLISEIRNDIKVANEYDKEQFNRYKNLLKSDFAYSNIEEFTKMKYNNSDEWNKLKFLYRNRKEVEEYKEKYSNVKHDKDGYIIDTNTWTSHQSIPSIYRPNAVIKYITKSESGIESISRNIFDNNSRLVKQIHNGNHGNAKAHPYGINGEHVHEFIWENDKIVNRIVRELNESEKKENGDIL